MRRALVIGYGSIGKRHVRLLSEIGCSVGVVSRQNVSDRHVFSDLRTALSDAQPNYVVIANETSRHANTIEELADAGYRGCVLVEKPLSSEFYAPPEGLFELIAVAYNLRFSPVMSALRRRLDIEEVIAVSVSAGQYLADWRPTRNFRETYSASREAGGGVLRDLSHELDYLLWMFGPWRRAAAIGGRLGVLGIDADEHWSALIEFTHAPVTQLRLSYLDRPARREIVITTRNSTIIADLVAGSLSVNGVVEEFGADRDASYLAMHRSMLNGDANTLCSAKEGVEVGKLIVALEAASTTRQWVFA